MPLYHFAHPRLLASPRIGGLPNGIRVISYCYAVKGLNFYSFHIRVYQNIPVMRHRHCVSIPKGMALVITHPVSITLRSYAKCQWFRYSQHCSNPHKHCTCGHSLILSTSEKLYIFVEQILYIYISVNLYYCLHKSFVMYDG